MHAAPERGGRAGPPHETQVEPDARPRDGQRHAFSQKTELEPEKERRGQRVAEREAAAELATGHEDVSVLGVCVCVWEGVGCRRGMDVKSDV